MAVRNLDRTFLNPPRFLIESVRLEAKLLRLLLENVGRDPELLRFGGWLGGHFGSSCPDTTTATAIRPPSPTAGEPRSRSRCCRADGSACPIPDERDAHRPCASPTRASTLPT